MKKLSLVLLTLLALVLLTFAGAESSLTLPAEFQTVLAPQLAQGWSVSDYLGRMGDAPYFAAVTLRSERGSNRLVVLAEDAQGWNVYLTTDIALSQRVPNRLLNRSHTTYAGLSLQTAFSCIDDTSPATETVWEWDARNGQWVLRAFLLHDTDFSVILDTIVAQSTGLTYSGWRTEGRSVRYRGTVQTLLRYFDYSTFPKTPEEMRRKLTVAPTIPEGELTAQSIKFTGGRKHNVYSGPGESYLRGGHQKATVSTNDWIQVFGRENGWILIQYAISSNHMRFGWIPDSTLPKNARVDELAFTPVSAYTNRRVTVTDDPLYSGAALLELPEGCWVTWLATMGDWAYIESSTGDMLRGFVPVDALRSELVFDLSSHPAGNALVLRGTVSVHPATGECTARIALAEGSPVQASAVITYGLFDDVTGKWLAYASSTDAAGYHIAHFTVLDETTSIRIVPQYAGGSYDEANAVVVAW